ncbi:scinderin like a [Pagrus major]|uniref:scinderin like a n=1 Tax=Pagrus major TaxID=143350 RepID=UPI003CC8CAD5
MVHHKEFETAGKEPGLQVWRLEKMNIVPVPKALQGSFYEGDAYIVLCTMDRSFYLHSWMGEKATQDERGASAIFMMQLDDHLGGSPTQFTEFQGQESRIFLSYFKKGIQYKKGGVASGFKQVETNAADMKRCLHVKGRRNIKAREVEMCWKSFNTDDCFIIVLGEDIFHWSGSNCNRYERLKTTELAIDIKDNELRGRGKIEMCDEGSEPEKLITVLGPKPNLPSSTSEDKHTDVKNSNNASLYVFSDASGTMKTTKVADKNPFKQDMLLMNECYILDNGGNKKIFVWKGKEASPDERKAARTAADKFIKEKNYDPNTQVQILAAGAETMLFKQFFFNWLDKDETTGPSKPFIMGRIAKVEQIPFDASTLHDTAAMAAQHSMVDDGSGKVKIWRVEGKDKVLTDPSTHGQFFGGDCYLVLYSYNTGGREKHIIYTWQGRKCSRDELGASAILTIALDDSMGGVATQVRVTQGQEPPHFVSMFKGKFLVIHLGGTSREGGQSEAGSKRLFHIRQSSTKATRAVEVEPYASSLNTNDVFVLKTPDTLNLWKGKGQTGEEMDAALYVASLLGGAATEVEEGKEPAAFWAALGGKKAYQTSKTLQMAVRAPRLFSCSNKTGNLIVEEVPGDFTQSDLLPDDVMILDTWAQIFVWIGKEANETEKTGSGKIVQDYVESDPAGRRGIPISTIKQEEEPLNFTGWFHAWDPKFWVKDFEQLLKQRLN